MVKTNDVLIISILNYGIRCNAPAIIWLCSLNIDPNLHKEKIFKHSKVRCT
jgi:hypothetical protein